MAVHSPGPDATLIFLHVPKTGGRTLATLLRRQDGASNVFEAYSHPRRRGRFGRMNGLRFSEFRTFLGLG